jgi:hypothetical protein
MIQCDHKLDVPGRNISIASHGDIVSYVDGNRWREDYTHDGITYSSSRGDTYYFQYLRDPTVPPGRSGLVAKDLKAVNLGDPEYRHFDPLKLMFAPVSYQATKLFPIDYVIGSSARENIGFERALSDGVVAWKVSCVWTGVGRWNIRYWVVPSLGFNVTRMEAESLEGYSAGTKAVIECELRAVADGIWFPARIHFEQHGPGESIVEDLVIRTSQINEGLGSAIFEPAEMNIPIGTVVARMPRLPDHQALKWNGRALVPMTPRERFGYIATSRTGIRFWMVLAVISGGFALVGAGFLLLGAFRRHKHARDRF